MVVRPNWVDEALECLHNVHKAERHVQELEQPKLIDPHCFGDMQWVDRHLVVSTDEVDFGKNDFSSQVGIKTERCSCVIE